MKVKTKPTTYKVTTDVYRSATGRVTVKVKGEPPKTYGNIGTVYVGSKNVTLCNLDGSARLRYNRRYVSNLSI